MEVLLWWQGRAASIATAIEERLTNPGGLFELVTNPGDPILSTKRKHGPKGRADSLLFCWTLQL